jgi:hypothetical protein
MNACAQSRQKIGIFRNPCPAPAFEAEQETVVQL